MGDAKKPDFSNVQSGASSTAPTAPKADFGNVQSGVASTAPTVDPSPQTYTVNKGDTLSKIAKEFYGSANRWHEIFDANRDTIKDPDLIQPGQVLALPPNA